ncbi:hypothetical protein J2P12_07445 [Candidatus Bathyarchaeota archaeon]|nr:hypothetical protein [Candidatus Bathyarchaeota archaeon]
MLKVELKMLPGEAEAAARFLQSHIKGQIEVHGNQVQLGDEQASEVKLLLHKFLRREGLTGYRVLSQAGIIRITPDNRERPHEQPRDDKVRGVAPFPPLSQERLPLMNVV